MRFEQPSKLNRYVDPTLPLTWAKRRELIQPGLPLLAVSLALGMEMIAFRLWLNDGSIVAGLLRILLFAGALAVITVGAAELTLRTGHHSKRRLKLDKKKVSISHARHGILAWKQILGWRLEPLADHPQLRKLTVDYAFARRGGRTRSWSMVLSHPDQTQALKSELHVLRQMGTAAAFVEELPRSMDNPERRARLRGGVQLALAFYFLIHGLPLLAAGLLPPGQSSETSTHSNFSPKEREKLERMVVKHFASGKEFKRFILIVGGGLTALGAGLCVGSVMAMSNKREG